MTATTRNKRIAAEWLAKLETQRPKSKTANTYFGAALDLVFSSAYDALGRLFVVTDGAPEEDRVGVDLPHAIVASLSRRLGGRSLEINAIGVSITKVGRAFLARMVGVGARIRDTGHRFVDGFDDFGVRDSSVVWQEGPYVIVEPTDSMERFSAGYGSTAASCVVFLLDVSSSMRKDCSDEAAMEALDKVWLMMPGWRFGLWLWCCWW